MQINNGYNFWIFTIIHFSISADFSAEATPYQFRGTTLPCAKIYYKIYSVFCCLDDLILTRPVHIILRQLVVVEIDPQISSVLDGPVNYADDGHCIIEVPFSGWPRHSRPAVRGRLRAYTVIVALSSIRSSCRCARFPGDTRQGVCIYRCGGVQKLHL